MPSVDPSIEAVLRKAPLTGCQLREARHTDAYVEARRAMEICNACRYCEGFCAVFPAMTRRRDFADADLNYLANLCHGCRACFYSCQYAPPHEFGINVPKVFAEVRLRSYEQYCWPKPLGRLFRRNGSIVASAMAVGTIVSVLLALWLIDGAVLFQPARHPGAFYAIVPYWIMMSLAGAASLFALTSVTIGAMAFWRDVAGRQQVHARSVRAAMYDALSLRNLDGGAGQGCNDRDESYSKARRYFHHAMFYGFALCFAATCVATVYDHILGRKAPYDFWSIPVQLGLWGGIGLLVGTSGLAWVKVRGDPMPTSASAAGSDNALLILLALTALTGLLLLALRGTAAAGILLAVHLGNVVTLFVAIPYSKMIHGIYRSAALLYSALESDSETRRSSP
jgi:citrate/tricarballylate utilization protein